MSLEPRPAPGPGDETGDVLLISYNLEGVFRRRDRLYEDVFRHYVGCRLEGALFAQLAREAAALLACDAGVVEASLLYLLGREPVPQELRPACWRLAGNVRVLRRGRACPPWGAQPEPEWVPLQVLAGCWSARRGRGNQVQAGFRYRLRVLAGSPCPALLDVFWPHGLAGLFSSRLGFSRRAPLADGSELVRLRFYGLFTAETCEAGPGFREVRCPPGCLRHNREVLARRRREDFVCPEGYHHDCHTCHVGYDRCPAACHPLSYVRRRCVRCQQERWHDPDPAFTPGLCIGCRAAEAAAGARERR